MKVLIIMISIYCIIITVNTTNIMNTFCIYIIILNFILFTFSYSDSLTSDHSSTMDLYEHICSKNGRWCLTLQDDGFEKSLLFSNGNVVGYPSHNQLYTTLQNDNNVDLVKSDSYSRKPFFATNTSCYDLLHHRGIECGRYASFEMQSDGNLVVYTQSTLPVWSTNTQEKGIGPYKVIIQNDRNIVLTDSKNEILWSSNTTYYD